MPDVRNRAPWVAAALATGTLLLAAGCGGSEKPDPARGKELFTQRCGACHILANAGTKGVQGPNLDLAFKQSIEDGLGRSTIEGVVRKQIALPQGNQMPANLVEGKDADAVAAYVASAIGKKARAAAAARRAPRRRTRRTRSRSPRTPTVSSRTSSRAPRPRPGR